MSDLTINNKNARNTLNRKVGKLHQLEFIFDELARRIVSRLDYIKLDPKSVLDCGSGLGFDRELLMNKYPNAKFFELDSSIELLRLNKPAKKWLSKIFTDKSKRNLICADAYNLPIANGSINFCYSNMLLPYISEIPDFIKEMRRVLALGGSFCISGLGVDSFKELRALGLSTYRFPDMHDIGDMLVDAGFSNPVVDTEYLNLDYDDLRTLLSDIRLIGCGAANDPTRQKFLSKEKYAEILSKNSLPHKLTLEIFVAHGWKDQHKIDLPQGHSMINFKR